MNEGEGSDSIHPSAFSPQPSPYPWKSPEHDLAEARQLIDKHGDFRRIEELTDVESIILRQL